MRRLVASVLTVAVKLVVQEQDAVLIVRDHVEHVFADGALYAAEWVRGRRGVFTMRDVLDLGTETA